MKVDTVIQGDCLEVLKTIPDKSINCCVTSPPYYGLRDYGCDGQIGLEETPEEYIDKLVQVFREVKRTLKDDGTLWVNIGDSYSGTGSKGDYKDPIYADGRNGQKVSLTQKVNGCKSKDLIGIPWMLAFALRNDGWFLRQDIIWHKPNPMPESVKDRCTKSHEYIFLLSKKSHYYFDYEAIQEQAKESTLKRINQDIDNQNGSYTPSKANGNMKAVASISHDKDETYVVRNKRDVWSVTTKPCKEAHFAVFPEDLIEPCILAGCPKNGIVLDPAGAENEVRVRGGYGFARPCGDVVAPDVLPFVAAPLADLDIVDHDVRAAVSSLAADGDFDKRIRRREKFVFLQGAEGAETGEVLRGDQRPPGRARCGGGIYLDILRRRTPSRAPVFHIAVG